MLLELVIRERQTDEFCCGLRKAIAILLPLTGQGSARCHKDFRTDYLLR
jgi:hypothetical protein